MYDCFLSFCEMTGGAYEAENCFAYLIILRDAERMTSMLIGLIAAGDYHW